MADLPRHVRPIAVGLLGTGYICDFHFRALRLLPQIEVRAVCDLNPRLAQQFAQTRGIEKVYDDFAQMLACVPLDVVHILTPPHAHFSNACQAIAAGVDALIEKPLCHNVNYCQQLRQLAATTNTAIAVSNNFLYFPAYEKFLADLRSGRLGKIDQIDIVWNKELPQLKNGPFGAWMLQSPQNILFEVAPHSFVHLIHILGQPEEIAVDVRDLLELPGALEFYRRWEIRGWKNNTSIRLRFSFIDGYPEHYIHVRGTNAVALVDFENNTYVLQEHTPYLLDIDRYAGVITTACNSILQANTTLASFVLSKMGLSKNSGPFAYSIARTISSFYNSRGRKLDERIDPVMSEAAVALAEKVAREVKLSTPQRVVPITNSLAATPTLQPTVLVIGGTGFIGQALVRRLRQHGYGVRILQRHPHPTPQLHHLKVEFIKGDFADEKTLEVALDGIRYVYHLARGHGKTWSDYLETDVKPTRQLANLCLQQGVAKLFYTSSIAIYYAGDKTATITEDTEPHQGIIRAAPYAKSKLENERSLLELYRHHSLPVTIFRPGIVLGRGGSPYHWGIAAWPYSSVCCVYGDGNNPLPIVLVDDVADAMVRAMKIPTVAGQSYNLASTPCITANEYLDEFERQANIKLRRVFKSPASSYIESVLKWVIKSIGNDPDAAFPSYADFQSRTFAAKFDCTKAERQLGWSPVKDRETIICEGIHVPVTEFFR
jgi:nucleoside-diphosphate-sugar epimerase/predicted dehydrogenase